MKSSFLIPLWTLFLPLISLFTFLVFDDSQTVFVRSYPSYRQSCELRGPDGAESDAGEGRMYRPYIFMSSRNRANATGFAFPFHFQIWYISMWLAVFCDIVSIRLTLSVCVCTTRCLLLVKWLCTWRCYEDISEAILTALEAVLYYKSQFISISLGRYDDIVDK